MTDTVKIQRPAFSRRSRDAGGRVVHDKRGNAILARTRANDGSGLSVDPSLSIVEDELGPDPLGPDWLALRNKRPARMATKKKR